MPHISSQFLDQLEKSRILNNSQVDVMRRHLSGLPDEIADADIARWAVKQKLITLFQAEEILNGRSRKLIVDNYVLYDILGYGGMGTVYLGRHRSTGRRVAVKLLGEQTKHDSGIRARFQLEAKAGMKLDHPKLVKTLELGQLEDLYGDTEFMVMELVEGVTLLEGINFSKGPLKWDAAADVICQAADGLEYLHNMNMVHRDVKPDNILIEVDGTAKLLDFGLTLADQSSAADEFSLAMIFGHDCLGTADFIPPEQSLDSLNVDGRADVYSLGCTLFTALTARRPFPGLKRPETVRAHRTEKRPNVREFNDSVPAEIADTVLQMMAIDPAERPATMQDVKSRLEPFRKKRNWAFEFSKVLVQRREMRNRYLSDSRARSAQRQLPTTVNSRDETETPGQPPVGDGEEFK